MSNDMDRPPTGMATDNTPMVSPNVYTGISPNLDPVTKSDDNDTAEDKFEKAIKFTSNPSVEGGYVVDNGGPTNYGLTQHIFDTYNSSHGYQHMDVADATPDDAKKVMKEIYFDKPGLGDLPTRTAIAMFDYAINSGVPQATKDLQRVVGVTPDSILGHNTKNAVSSYVGQNGEDSLLSGLNDRRKILQRTLIHNNPQVFVPKAKGMAHRNVHLQQYLGWGQPQQDSNDSDGG